MHTTLQTSLSGTQYMKTDCEELLDHMNVLMASAHAIEHTKWRSKQGVESLQRLTELLQDCQALINDCRNKPKIKGGIFTNKEKLSQQIQGEFEEKFEALKCQMNDLNVFLVSFI